MTGEEFAAALRKVTAQARDMLPAASLDALEAAIDRLAQSGLAQSALNVGDMAPDFVLPDAFGRAIRSVDLRAQGPLVINFYRGGWCPYCNLALRALQAHLPAIEGAGGALVAISPQTPDASLSTQEKYALGYTVLSDVGNAVARRFGLVFTVEEALRPLYAAMGADLEAANGEASFTLPIPATYVVAQDGEVLFAFVSADYRKRPAPEALVAALKCARG